MENVLVAGAGLGLTTGGSWRQVSVGRNSSALLTVVPEPAHVIQQHRTMLRPCQLSESGVNTSYVSHNP